ncbi:MAG: GFA family protein [Kofleriaceae bacterium]
MTKLAIEGTCLCRAVTLGAARLPRQVTQCNCSVCRRYGTLWAYYPRSAVTITAARGALEHYSVRARGLKFVRCRSCGCVICWDSRSKDPERRLGINTRLLDPALMARVPVKVLDGDKTWRSLGTYAKPDIWISPPPAARRSTKRPAKR